MAFRGQRRTRSAIVATGTPVEADLEAPQQAKVVVSTCWNCAMGVKVRNELLLPGDETTEV